jgi:hypothetical protein
MRDGLGPYLFAFARFEEFVSRNELAVSLNSPWLFGKTRYRKLLNIFVRVGEDNYSGSDLAGQGHYRPRDRAVMALQ